MIEYMRKISVRKNTPTVTIHSQVNNQGNIVNVKSVSYSNYRGVRTMSAKAKIPPKGTLDHAQYLFKKHAPNITKDELNSLLKEIRYGAKEK